jgi:hypothetical protein
MDKPASDGGGEASAKNKPEDERKLILYEPDVEYSYCVVDGKLIKYTRTLDDAKNILSSRSEVIHDLAAAAKKKKSQEPQYTS